jgi:hypothetical protein
MILAIPFAFLHKCHMGMLRLAQGTPLAPECPHHLLSEGSCCLPWDCDVSRSLCGVSRLPSVVDRVVLPMERGIQGVCDHHEPLFRVYADVTERGRSWIMASAKPKDRCVKRRMRGR